MADFEGSKFVNFEFEINITNVKTCIVTTRFLLDCTSFSQWMIANLTYYRCTII